MDCVRNASGFARRVLVAVPAVLSIVGAAVGIGVTATPARATTPHRVAVVVYADGVVHTAKVTFTSDSISGLDALNDAGLSPLVRVFGGNGGAVCALDVSGTTIGCPADNSCLTCAQPSYWAYFRAVAGATRYTYSLAGAGNTQVHDGDVEAWAWGTGSPPTPFVSFTDVWGSGPPTTTRSTAPPSTRPPSSLPSPTVSALATAPTVAPATVPVSGASGPATKPTVKPSTSKISRPGSSDPTTTDTVAVPSRTRKVATAPVVARGNGGSPEGVIGFAAMLAVLIAAIVFARRRRSVASRGSARAARAPS